MKLLITISIIVTVISVLVGCRKKPQSTPSGSQQFVSMTCEKGDITLTLSETGSFSMTLKYWDPDTQQHTHEDKITGNWTKEQEQLILNSDNIQIIYELNKSTFKIGNSSVTVDNYAWISSTSKTPFDTYDLDEREGTDAFLKRGI